MTSRETGATAMWDRLTQKNRVVSESFTARSFRAGEEVATADEIGQSLFLVASGRVQLYRTTPDGRRFVIATLGPGSIFGEDSVLGELAVNTRAVALQDGTVSMMPSHRVKELSSHEAMFSLGLMQAMGRRVVEAENRLEQMAYGSVSARLAALLLDLAGDSSNGSVQATHQELAEMLGTWRETVSKTLQEMRRSGLVSPSRRSVRILDREKLRLEAEGG